jgi:hypothetical protein
MGVSILVGIILVLLGICLWQARRIDELSCSEPEGMCALCDEITADSWCQEQQVYQD